MGRGVKAKEIKILDIVTQEEKEVTYTYLSGLTGRSKSVLRTYKCRELELNEISCYIIEKNTPKAEKKELLNKTISESYKEELWNYSPLLGTEYMVSTLGRVRERKEGKWRVVMRVVREKRGEGVVYVRVKLKGEERKKYITVKKLVYSTFAPEEYKEGRYILLHKDKNINNCEYTNLRRVESKEVGYIYQNMRKDIEGVLMLDQNTYKPIGLYKSQKEVERKTGINRVLINMAIKYREEKDNVLSVAGGYRFEPIESVEEYRKKNPNIKYYNDEGRLKELKKKYSM